MAGEGTILGTTKIVHGWRMSLLAGVRDRLDLEIGDRVVYRELDDGRIVVESAHTADK